MIDTTLPARAGDAAVVRAAGPTDLPAIVALSWESMALHGGRDPAFRPRADSHLAFERFVAERIALPEARVVVAEADERAAAYGICVLRRRPDYFEPGEHGLITDLDVSAAHRRQGLGERALDALCKWLILPRAGGARSTHPCAGTSRM